MLPNKSSKKHPFSRSGIEKHEVRRDGIPLKGTANASMHDRRAQRTCMFVAVTDPKANPNRKSRTRTRVNTWSGSKRKKRNVRRVMALAAAKGANVCVCGLLLNRSSIQVSFYRPVRVALSRRCGATGRGRATVGAGGSIAALLLVGVALAEVMIRERRHDVDLGPLLHVEADGGPDALRVLVRRVGVVGEGVHEGLDVHHGVLLRHLVDALQQAVDERLAVRLLLVLTLRALLIGALLRRVHELDDAVDRLRLRVGRQLRDVPQRHDVKHHVDDAVRRHRRHLFGDRGRGGRRSGNGVEELGEVEGGLGAEARRRGRRLRVRTVHLQEVHEADDDGALEDLGHHADPLLERVRAAGRRLEERLGELGRRVHGVRDRVVVEIVPRLAQLVGVGDELLELLHQAVRREAS
mmetsp:Transcript_20687/g.64331  ORF Transcript_20687/g.64331 Transcript_20687/m.64331 type:complete len:409 (+) Transcript_20687:95-1321(+)